MSASTSETHAVCIDNEGFQASLEIRKIYQLVPDESAKSSGFVRVVDESGEDYLYPSNMFQPIPLSDDLRRALRFTTSS